MSVTGFGPITIISGPDCHTRANLGARHISYCKLDGSHNTVLVRFHGCCAMAWLSDILAVWMSCELVRFSATCSMLYGSQFALDDRLTLVGPIHLVSLNVPLPGGEEKLF